MCNAPYLSCSRVSRRNPKQNARVCLNCSSIYKYIRIAFVCLRPTTITPILQEPRLSLKSKTCCRYFIVHTHTHARAHICTRTHIHTSKTRSCAQQTRCRRGVLGDDISPELLTTHTRVDPHVQRTILKLFQGFTTKAKTERTGLS